MARFPMSASTVTVVAFVLAFTASIAAQDVFSSSDAGVMLPSPATTVQPVYTPRALQARVEGTVLLDTVVLADGTVGDIAVKESLDDDLDKQAIDAMKQWTFKPGTKDGKAVAVRVAVQMQFTLR
jgi:TonB family protein